MTREEFTKDIMLAVTGYAFLDALFAADAFARPVKPIANHWVVRLNEYCNDLKKDALSPLEWQQQVEGLFNQIELKELLQFIDFEQLTSRMELPDLGVGTRNVAFPKLADLPEDMVFIRKVFGIKKDRAIIPHGHSNMASAHLILDGEMHLRHYDKIAVQDQRMTIKPTIDRMVRPGESSSISDDKDNVHWFIANTERAFTFDVIMLDLNGKSYDIHNLDIYEKLDRPDGTMEVPILGVDEALKKYGKHSHH